MTKGFKLTLIWLGASLAALAVALAPVSAAFSDGHFVPIGPDGFYHARRILDAVANPGAFFQFDTHTHFPDGDLVTWPWAYDFVVSLIVRAALWLHLSNDPMAVLVHLPPLAFPLALALMLSICRSLNLSLVATALAMFATALFPLSQSLYAIGNIDHHYVEHMFVLGTLAATLRWLRRPDSRACALAAGVVFGTATGVHTALFALQLPLLATLLILWLRRQPLPTGTPWFAGALLASQLLVALPSLALQRMYFDYYTLSWFQVYIAACTAIVVMLLSRLRPGRGSIAVLIGVALVLLIPTVRQVLYARDFFTHAIAGMDDISEVRSMFELWRDIGSFGYVAALYTWLVTLLPLTVLWCLWRGWRTREPAETHFCIAALAGAAMLVAQLRLQYFGSFALYLPMILALDRWTHSRPRLAIPAATVATAILVSAYLPGLRSVVFAPQMLAGDPNYAVTRPIYLSLHDACSRHPGVVLADPWDGHYLRFHADCAVIGNNFLVTPADAAKILEEKNLLRLAAREIPDAAPAVDYVFVRSATIFFVNSSGLLEFAPGEYPDRPNYPLVRELLAADPQHLPAHYRMLAELRPVPQVPPLARLFAIERDAATR